MKYEVLAIKGVLSKEKLPARYTNSAPSFWLTRSRRTLKLFDGRTLSVGGVYRRGVFERFVRDIRIAGDRLHEINAENHDTDTEMQKIHKFEGTRTIKI